MKTLHSDFKRGIAKILIENLDDLWYLSSIIEPGDLISGKTERKIKIGGGKGNEDKAAKIIRKTIFLKIRAEKTEFSKTSNNLRVLGTIVEGPEDLARGDHHSFNLEENYQFTLEKATWLKFQIDKLKEASSGVQSNILLCIHDREEAYFALMKKYGYDLLTKISGDVIKKADDASSATGKNFYAEIIKIIKDYDSKYKFDNIIIASPAFWKEELQKTLKSGEEELKKKIVLATVSGCDEKAFNELLKRSEVQNVLKQERTAKEIQLVEKLLEEISKDDKAAYGINEVKNAANAGAVETLLVTDNLIQKSREENNGEDYKIIENIMKTTEQTNGKIHIISSEHDGGKKLDGISGIGGILRYKLS
ncbi:mRNA surveillance protein pelota [Nanoarchaeota archaeon]